MGYPMAGHVIRAGMNVCVYNRTVSKAEKWVKQFGGNLALTPAAAAAGCDVVLVCVGNDDDVRSVVLGNEGALAGMDEGKILVDHTTASAELARELDAATRAQGKEFLDAPVSGGQAGAENGILTVMIGGEEGTYEVARPVIDSYSRFNRLLGPAGNGQLAKMVNQICIASVVQGLAEGLDFARRAGLDGESLIETISKGAASSWQMENRYQTLLKLMGGHQRHSPKYKAYLAESIQKKSGLHHFVRGIASSPCSMSKETSLSTCWPERATLSACAESIVVI